MPAGGCRYGKAEEQQVCQVILRYLANRSQTVRRIRRLKDAFGAAGMLMRQGIRCNGALTARSVPLWREADCEG